MPTTAPAGSLGASGEMAGRRPASTTSGWNTPTAPVAGSSTLASTNAAWASLDSWQAPLRRSVATSWYGVARPWALSGSAGTTSVQLGLGSAGGWLRVAASTAPAPPPTTSGTAMAAASSTGRRGRPRRGRWDRMGRCRRGILASPGRGSGEVHRGELAGGVLDRALVDHVVRDVLEQRTGTAG